MDPDPSRVVHGDLYRWNWIGEAVKRGRKRLVHWGQLQVRVEVPGLGHDRSMTEAGSGLSHCETDHGCRPRICAWYCVVTLLLLGLLVLRVADLLMYQT